MIKWAELIPVMCGNYAVGLECSGNGAPQPALCDTKEEVLAEIQDMQDCYNEDIANGERDEGDKWEGEAHRVLFDGVKLFLVDDDDQPFEEIDWRAQLS